MTVVREGELEFTFGPSWRVLKYDENGSYYKTQLARQIGRTKAVDFLCLRDDMPLLMLEVKDFGRGVPDREKFDQLPMVVATKARDTLAGIIGGMHCAGGTGKRVFRDAYDKLTGPPRVVYLFEDLAIPARRPIGRSANKKDVLLKQLKRHLRWLTRKVMVIGLDDYRSVLCDVTIRRLRGRE